MSISPDFDASIGGRELGSWVYLARRTPHPNLLPREKGQEPALIPTFSQGKKGQELALTPTSLGNQSRKIA